MFPCLSLPWYGRVFHFTRKLFAPFWCVPCFVFRFLYTCIVVNAWDWLAIFVWCECCYSYLHCRKIDNLLLEMDFVCLTSDGLTTNISAKPVHVVFFTIHQLTICICFDWIVVNISHRGMLLYIYMSHPFNILPLKYFYLPVSMSAVS